MTSLRGARQRENARKATRDMLRLAKQNPAKSSPREGCLNPGGGEWFTVAGSWSLADYEPGENCGECEWCDENDY